MKKYKGLIIALTACFALMIFGCKQAYIQGVESSTETEKIYFPDAAGSNNVLIPALEKNYLALDTIAHTVHISIPVYKGGFSPSNPFTVKVSADNSAIDGLIASGDLPSNTIKLSPNDYLLASQDTLSLGAGAFAMGTVTPKIKAEALEEYSGKVAALGLTLSGSSKYVVNKEMNKVIVYFPVDSIVGKIYFNDVKLSGKQAISVLNRYEVDTLTNTVGFPIPIKRAGFADLKNFTVNVDVDNSLVTNLIHSGDLPANTVSLTANDFHIDNTVSISSKDGTLQGKVLPEINIDKLQQYIGKTVAIGLMISSASKFDVDHSLNKIVLYFDVNTLLGYVVPPHNQIELSSWNVLNIAGNSNVTVSFNQDSSKIIFAGGAGGHMAVWQKVSVIGNKEYKIDLHVKGSGATNVWFEAYVGTTVPQPGSDYKDNKLISLNTWSGCGVNPFDGWLAQLNCNGPGNIVSFPNSGYVYVLIKSGGDNLGSTGITVSDVVFIRME